MASTRDEERRLIQDISAKRGTGEASHATLRTDDRVLARVTDGIYRQPASALRELISNAYDADATEVIIQTDAPRFREVTVRDNGNGMDVNALARLINHIGGSSKRRPEGGDIGVTSKDDSSLSPGGRRLIGKIGIGLFSVSQLTRHFQIVTKVKDSNYRLIAEVVLKTYSEDEREEDADSDTVDSIETGTVRIMSVEAEDLESQGTEMTLMNLRPQAREILQSKEAWDRFLVENKVSGAGSSSNAMRPEYHIGQFVNKSESIAIPANLPWKADASASDRFRQMVDSIKRETVKSTQNPKLDKTLDNYLQMLWTLSVSAPVEYIDGHPFDETHAKDLSVFRLDPAKGGQAVPVALQAEEKIRDVLSLKSPENGPSHLTFTVSIDDVQLLRPVQFHKLPSTRHALKEPILFAGKASPDLGKIHIDERGGRLEFEAYFLWAPKIVPKENNGLLIRIGDASGTLFDETFAKYQVAELTRLRQITSEVFIIRGLDAALNIDRESFNYGGFNSEAQHRVS